MNYTMVILLKVLLKDQLGMALFLDFLNSPISEINTDDAQVHLLCYDNTILLYSFSDEYFCHDEC